MLFRVLQMLTRRVLVDAENKYTQTRAGLTVLEFVGAGNYFGIRLSQREEMLNNELS
jgi:hypothetical protein